MCGCSIIETTLTLYKERLEALSKAGDPAEVLQNTVDFEVIRGWLVEGLGYGAGGKGGRPLFESVSGL